MFRGKYWILPDLTCINCSAGEHAQVAKLFILKTSEEEAHHPPLKDCFKPPTAEHAARALKRGADPKLVESLLKGHDPRVPAINLLGWVRVRGNDFYVSGNDASGGIFLIRHCHEYWKTQPSLDHNDRMIIHWLPCGESPGSSTDERVIYGPIPETVKIRLAALSDLKNGRGL